MTTTIRLSDKIVNEARTYAKIEHRSTAKQIEYWAMLGRTATENPDLPIDFIKSTLLAIEQAKNGDTEPYEFG